MGNFNIDIEILRDAINKFGAESQVKMAIGEIGELLTMFGREEQGRANSDEWVSEIADVLIMVTQLGMMYGQEKVQKTIDFKLERLRVKLNKPNDQD
tara:strand:+ start:998 stop:1288 length:291 start_codon:yes stop_codon:yes gene_type:complete